MKPGDTSVPHAGFNDRHQVPNASTRASPSLSPHSLLEVLSVVENDRNRDTPADHLSRAQLPLTRRGIVEILEEAISIVDQHLGEQNDKQDQDRPQ